MRQEGSPEQLEKTTVPKDLESWDDFLSENIDNYPVESVDKKKSKAKEVDTQNMTLDDAFLNFTEEEGESIQNSSSLHQKADEKKKRVES